LALVFPNLLANEAPVIISRGELWVKTMALRARREKQWSAPPTAGDAPFT
jgi:hypothetical protein